MKVRNKWVMKDFFKTSIVTSVLSLSLLVGSTGAQEEKPQPDLWAAEIIAPQGIAQGPGNEVRVIVENRTRDSKVEGTVKVELVVIQLDSSDRASYFAEVEGMDGGRKREAVFSGIEAKNDDSVRLLAIVDPEKLVPESNEGNNRKLYKVWVKKPEPSSTLTEEE